MTYGREIYFYRKDNFGNIIKIVDKNGDDVVQYKYDAWGNHVVLNPDGSENESSTFIGNINPFRYRGYYYDVETGLYYLKTRYYDPKIGRFITIDDISYLAPDTINGLNLYAYCLNNPVMIVDPNGTMGIIAGIIIGITIGAVIVGTGAAIYAGVTAYNNGYRGWDLVGTIGEGFIKGAIVGAILGALVAMFIYTAPAIGSFLSSTFTIGSIVTSSGTMAVITVTGAQIAAAGAAAALGLGIIMFSKNNPNMSNKPPVSWTDVDEGLDVFEKVGRDPSKAATYLLDQFYGKGNWTHDYKYGFNALRKWFDRIIRNWPRKG